MLVQLKYNIFQALRFYICTVFSYYKLPFSLKMRQNIAVIDQFRIFTHIFLTFDGEGSTLRLFSG